MRSRKSRGSVITEFALGSALLFTLLTGTFQFGYTFYQYNHLHSAVRSAALYASLRSYDSPSQAPSPAFRDAVRNMAVFGSPVPEPGRPPVAPGLSAENVDVRVTFQNQLPVSVTVSIVDYPITGLFKTYTFHNSPRITFRYLGRFAGGG
ncbi:MAG: TadE/TadG family type IV pilus assembly protein [Bryobacteraceae bacterium]|nr:TadE/TadG family type IV pilus assembly protein [Bryobacteraceae bacterium]